MSKGWIAGTIMSSNKHFPVPKTNIEIYKILFTIETGLRELIITSLESKVGPRWYKNRLPGDVLTKSREGIKYERSIKWTQLIPHHPIYYVEFTDLKKIIQRTDNWEGVFKEIFSRQDILASTLSELEPIRNKVAHSRKCSRQDLETVKSAHKKLINAIGEEEFYKLISRYTIALDIPERINQMQYEARDNFNKCINFELIESLCNWDSIRKEWWFGETYLDHKLESIILFYNKLTEYANLPRSRGTGHLIEGWVKSSNIQELYNQAQKEFETILDSWRVK